MCKVYGLHKCANALYRYGVPVLPALIFYVIRIFFSAHIPYKARIGAGTTFGCGGLGVVLHPSVIIGQNCNIAQNVTIGGRAELAGIPVIGNNVLVGAGAKILGPVRVGDNVKVGANAVVIKDVPSNCTVVGIPATIVKRDRKAARTEAA